MATGGPAVRPDLLVREVGEELVVLDPCTDRAHALTPPAAQAFLALRDGRPADGAAVAQLAAAGLLVAAPSRRGVLLGAGAGAAALVTTLAVPAAAAAASTPTPAPSGSPTPTFDTTPKTLPAGSSARVPVPTGATAVVVEAHGGRGGGRTAGTGAPGAVVTSTVPLPAGTTVLELVAGGDADFVEGGYPGYDQHGGAGQGEPVRNGSGGGGASYVAAEANGTLVLLLVAGGGGGRGSSFAGGSAAPAPGHLPGGTVSPGGNGTDGSGGDVGGKGGTTVGGAGSLNGATGPSSGLPGYAGSTAAPGTGAGGGGNAGGSEGHAGGAGGGAGSSYSAADYDIAESTATSGITYAFA